MKKIFFVLTAMFVAITVNAQESQDNTPLFKDFSFEIKSLYGIKQHGLQPLSLDLQGGYEFANRWTLLACAEASHTLMDNNGVKSYAKDISLGGGFAYVWYDGAKDRLDLRMQVLKTIGSPEWNHTTFDIGTTWYGKPNKNGIAPLMGIGFRYEKSHIPGIRDWFGIYATVGIRF
ncbi:MAG: hypothetical protein J6Y78_17740 [Paludibacteraceae bacterium]|nr:hypothetical protein [Paludibacteraceae bacterium]